MVSDLLDQVVFDAGAPDAAYRAAARRWLNLTRSMIAGECLWRSALNPVATLTTSSATTSGVYTLSGFEFISGDFYDQTNHQTIRHAGLDELNAADPAKETLSKPIHWADAGFDSNGVRQVYLWPVPNGTFVLRFSGYRALEALTASDETDTVDAFFGPIDPWASCFAEGLRFYHDMNNNEDSAQVGLQRAAFLSAISRRKTQNRLSLTSTVGQRILRTQSVMNVGRFDPSHFQN